MVAFFALFKTNFSRFSSFCRFNTTRERIGEVFFEFSEGNSEDSGANKRQSLMQSAGGEN